MIYLGAASDPGTPVNHQRKIGRGNPEPGRHAPNAIDNFCFDVTLSYRRLERPRRVRAR